jgi:hydroxymethylbilane synthase
MVIATRGSALALAQANAVIAQCRAAFPRLRFELKIIKTTGDKQQRASLAQKTGNLPKGLFTKELEVALLKHQADLAVHSLKDLPTGLPAGLKLAATPKRADVRDVLIYRDAEFLREETAEWSPGLSALRGCQPHTTLKDFPAKAVIATSSTRRKAQLLAQWPDFNVVEIRGNLTTRLQKVADRPELDATVLAFAGISRLNFRITPEGRLEGDAVPDGLFATVLDVAEMLPCVGQAAIGIEIRAHDERLATICERLNHFNTFQCITAERAFLHAMGGGCASPVAAHAEVVGDQIQMRVVSFIGGRCRRAEGRRSLKEPAELGGALAAELKKP